MPRNETALNPLTERAVLTRAICRELSDFPQELGGWRPLVAMSLLLRWIEQHYPQSLRYVAAAGNVCTKEAHPSDGIDEMSVPEGCEDLLQEIRDGAAVGDALAMLWTADSALESANDRAVIRERLAAYWAKHTEAVRAPHILE